MRMPAESLVVAVNSAGVRVEAVAGGWGVQAELGMATMRASTVAGVTAGTRSHAPVRNLPPQRMGVRCRGWVEPVKPLIVQPKRCIATRILRPFSEWPGPVRMVRSEVST